MQANFGDLYRSSSMSIPTTTISLTNVSSSKLTSSRASFLNSEMARDLLDYQKRLIKYQAAVLDKMRGGITIGCMRDFADNDNFSYTFDHLKSFDFLNILESNSKVNENCTAKES